MSSATATAAARNRNERAHIVQRGCQLDLFVPDAVHRGDPARGTLTACSWPMMSKRSMGQQLVYAFHRITVPLKLPYRAAAPDASRSHPFVIYFASHKNPSSSGGGPADGTTIFRRLHRMRILPGDDVRRKRIIKRPGRVIIYLVGVCHYCGVYKLPPIPYD